MEYFANEINEIDDGDFGLPDTIKHFLAKELKLNILHSVDDGVLTAKTPNGTEELVVRLVESDVVSKRELTEWPRLKHNNILRLLSVQYLPVLDVFAFITVNHPISLLTILKNDDFFKSDKSVYVQKWLREVLSGLQYLHDKGKCHFGVCLENIMISNEFSAVIKAPSNRFDVPVSYRAPETEFFTGKTVPVDGIPFDLWCFGILSLKVFTSNFVTTVKNFDETTLCWWSDIYVDLYDSLQNRTFLEFVELTFSKNKMDTNTVTCMRNFVTSCLRLHPDDRPSTQQLMDHKYLLDTGCLATSDEMWENKVDRPYHQKSRLSKAKQWFLNKCKGTASRFKTCIS